MAPASPPIAIAELRRQLERLESHDRAEGTVLPFGIASLDRHLPGGGLALGHLHEVIEGGAAGERKNADRAIDPETKATWLKLAKEWRKLCDRTQSALDSLHSDQTKP